MLKRIIPFLCAAVVLMASLSPSVGAVSRDDYYFIDLDDYTSSYAPDAEGRLRARVSLPLDLCAVQTIDMNGTVYGDPGVFSGSLSMYAVEGDSMAVGVYWPGSYTTGVFLDVTDVPDGTAMSVSGQFTLSDVGYQADLGVYAVLGIQYFDAQYKTVGYQRSSKTYWNIDDSQVNGSHDVTLKISKPDNAVYFCYYAAFNLTLNRTNMYDYEILNVDWQISVPDIWVYFNNNNIPDYGYLDEFDSVSWLADCVDSFLEIQVAPGFALNKVLYFILVIGVLFWFLKVIS